MCSVPNSKPVLAELEIASFLGLCESFIFSGLGMRYTRFLQTSHKLCIILLIVTHTQVAQKKEILLSKASLVPQGGAEPYGYLKVKTFGGYDCKFVEQPPSPFQTECPVCRLLLREPYQATCCGTSFCHYCILHVKAEDKPCPVCRQTKFELFHDKRLKRSLHQLHVLCTYSKDGCNWSGELGDLDHHLNKVIHPGKSSFKCKK